jgi:hypothetical protein
MCFFICPARETNPKTVERLEADSFVVVPLSQLRGNRLALPSGR